jgi:SNF2 family DNA or RNA helicase
VIAPTSLLANWQSELNQFAPELRALVYRGPARERLLNELGPQVVVITSYELLLRDRVQLSEHSFATQVIDEAQAIRNARTGRAEAVAGVRAGFRLALTGTPIENRLGDLWSLFSLIAPGLLGSWGRFRAIFAVPIERYEERDRAERLRSLVDPFLLRRTKDQVAPELPARTEVLQAVELSAPEQQLYAASLAQARTALGKRKHKDQEFAVHILAELTRLRQLACHPRLVIEDSRIESSKLHALLRLLDDILPRGHRALVFSQFAKHLGLVREALQARGVELLYLDGSTPSGERAQLIQSFQAGAAPVFLISLKAGGTGLNLTAADYVVHLDPWWNPAALDQASDRAHRIGQVRPVTIVKLIAQGTIEERVLGLHEHKRRLAADMLSGEHANPHLDQEALEALLAD